jgi:hypothetical protein
MSNEVIKQASSTALNWSDVSGADTYHLQVSTTPDFSAPFVDQDFLTTSNLTFTDLAASDTTYEQTRRWWRWRSSADGGGTWAAWSEVGSYWFDSGADADLALSNNTWALINPSDTTDRYVLEVFPVYTVTPTMINRLRQRNRKGNMMSEYVNAKDTIILSFDQSRFVQRAQFSEILRFHHQIKTFLLAAVTYNGRDYVPHAWQVQFQSDPVLTMMMAGRQDLLVGDINMEEI